MKANTMKTKHPHRRKALNSRMIGLWIGKLFRFGIIVGISYVILYPLLVKLSVAFMAKSDMYDMTVKWVPRKPSLDSFKEVLWLIDYPAYLFTTLAVSAGATVVQIASCTLAAYGLARFQFRGRNLIFVFVILTLVLPQQTYMVTTYMQYRYFDLYGLLGLFGVPGQSLISTPWPLLLMSLGCQAAKNGLFIYILRQFLSRLPGELEEAAWVDGAGVGRIFLRVMLPNAGPALVTVSVLSFVWTWNDLYAASTYMPTMKLFPTLLNTLTFTITRAAGGPTVIDTVQVSMLTNAAALLIVLPLILLFIVAQKFFVQGVERTGLTGM
ncbi:MAG: carbohydrate ABC transporter permease [Clostridiales bacterium]|nr:carbohydrate ABC transporter permease [Clostridiales bacterium]